MKKWLNIMFILTAAMILATAGSVFPQNGTDKVLKEISENNRSLIAQRQLTETNRIGSMVGSTLYNPFVEFTNLFPPSSDYGNLTEFKLVQPFDFPSAYSNRNKLSELRAQQSILDETILRQHILLEAKLYCIRLVYLNKRRMELMKRANVSEKVFGLYQAKLTVGEGNILDVNKAKLSLLNMQTDLLIVDNEIEVLNSKLSELNGGKKIKFGDTAYQAFSPLSEFSILESEIESRDPVMKSLKQKKLISQGELNLSKSLSLPKFELGYYFLGQNDAKFHGIHLGFTLPFWENNHRTDFHKAMTKYSVLEIQSHENEHYHETKELYEKYEAYNEALSSYRQTLDSSDNTAVLEKALLSGEISSLDYFLEVNYIYQSVDRYLELEMELNKVVAVLLKYRL